MEVKKDTKFQPGQSGNPKGKIPGTKNKVTRDIKDIISKFLDCFKDSDIEEVYGKLKDKKPDAILNFIGKIAPKDLNLTGDIKTGKEIDLSKLSKEDLDVVKAAQNIINSKCIDDDESSNS